MFPFCCLLKIFVYIYNMNVNKNQEIMTIGQVEKMNKLELSKLLQQINPMLYFRTNPRLTTTKNFRTIVKRELFK